MSYIKLAERAKFKPHIEQVMSVLTNTNDSLYVKGEYFGYFVNRLVSHYLNNPAAGGSCFNSNFFSESVKKDLQSSADQVGGLMNRNDPLESAADMSYIISAIYWGMTGSAHGVESVNYGVRAYLAGIVEKIHDSVGSLNQGNQKDATMAFRRHLIARGVLQHILIEEFRRKTSIYENGKVQENGDIWKDGKLVSP
jgi:hypothetical protein